MRYVKIVCAASIMMVGLLAGANAAGAATPHQNNGYTCNGGNIAPGTYTSIKVTGVCYMPAGTIVVEKNLVVAAGALLDAVTPGDPPANPLVPAKVLVGGNISVGHGAVLLLGCSPNIACQTGVTYDRVSGNLTAVGALGVVVHSTAFGGNFSLLGGGGGKGTCTSIPPLWLEDPSLANGEGPGMPLPVYSDSEDNSIGRNLTIVGMKSCWLGALRDRVGRNAIFSNNRMGDPDALEMENNLVTRNLVCFGNQPAVQFGDGAAAPNIVKGRALGQCGFRVVAPNPVPTGVLEHVAVKAASLGTYSGSHVETSVKSVVFGTTESNDVLAGEKNKVILKGAGLTGAVREKVLVTIRPNGASSFLAFDSCSCSFDGRSGNITIRAYGTTSVSGLTSGYFFVTSGGAGSGGLSTLAGYGTFSNVGQPGRVVSLVEYLKIT